MATASKKKVVRATAATKKPAAKKAAAPAKRGRPAGKAAAATKKPVKKAAAPAKKAPAKKAEKKPEVAKKSVQDYKDVINWKKWEAHNMDWLYIEVNAGDLMTELEAGVNNLSNCCDAILDCMLEGDGFIVEPKEKNKKSDSLTVRYYCDNLSEDRKKYFAK